MSMPRGACHLICESHVYVCVCVYIYIYINEDVHISVRIHEDRESSRRKSRCEIIMQKMHREDYDLICRARKQFVSLKEGSLVNLRTITVRLCLRCFIVCSGNEVTKGNAYVFAFGCEGRVYFRVIEWKIRASVNRAWLKINETRLHCEVSHFARFPQLFRVNSF